MTRVISQDSQTGGMWDPDNPRNHHEECDRLSRYSHSKQSSKNNDDDDDDDGYNTGGTYGGGNNEINNTYCEPIESAPLSYNEECKLNLLVATFWVVDLGITIITPKIKKLFN